MNGAKPRGFTGHLINRETNLQWFNGVKNSDVGKRCKVSSAKGHIIELYNDTRCLVKNDNGTEHVQLRSNVMVLR